MPASLIAHCDPLFQAICRLNRIGRIQRGSTIEYTQARTEIDDRLDALWDWLQKDANQRLAK